MFLMTLYSIWLRQLSQSTQNCCLNIVALDEMVDLFRSFLNHGHIQKPNSTVVFFIWKLIFFKSAQIVYITSINIK